MNADDSHAWNMNTKKKLGLPLIISVVCLVSLSRLIPHPPNFTPVVALGLFSGAFIASRGLSLLVVLSSMFVADIFLGFHSTLPFVYFSLVFITLLGGMLHEKKRAFGSIACVTLGSSLLFFVLTNLGVWLMQDLYPKTGLGLLMCYSAAIPFLKTAVLGDIFYTALLFLVFSEVKNLSAHDNKLCSAPNVELP